METVDKMNTTEKPTACCLCIPNKIGTYILGSLLVLGMFGGLGSLFNEQSMFAGLINILILGYPTCRFVQMALKDEKDTREAFAFAYKIVCYIGIFLGSLSLIPVIFFFLVAGIDHTGSIMSVAIFASVGLVLAWIVVIFFILHFVRVCEAYVDDDDSFKSAD